MLWVEGKSAECQIFFRHTANLANPRTGKKYKNSGAELSISPKPGYTATEMFEALNDGRLKAIWILCTNPADQSARCTTGGTGAKKSKICSGAGSITPNLKRLQYADIILPAAAWAEKEGTMTNSERRISHLNKIVEAPGEALPDAEIHLSFCKKNGL